MFDWLKEEIAKQTYAGMFSWKESDDAEYDVRDLIGVLEVLNIFDFPNAESKHPFSAYEKWSIPLDKFAKDHEDHKNNLSESKYYRLRRLLPDALCLYDHIRRDFREVHNKKCGGNAGHMNIVEQASTKKKAFEFPFGVPPLPPCEYRLTKGPTYPILAAFRNYVVINQRGFAVWQGGFKKVLAEWQELAELLVTETFNATKSVGRNPDQIGKSRQHWDSLHTKVQNRLLRAQIASGVAE